MTGQLSMLGGSVVEEGDRGAASHETGETDQSPFSSAGRADLDQTIKSNLILFDSPSQSVFVGADLINAC